MTPIAQKSFDMALKAQTTSDVTPPSNSGNSRDADKFVIRFPDGMRTEVTKVSKEQHTSMNTFVIQAIAEKLDRQKRQELILDALVKSLEQQLADKKHQQENML